MKLSDLVEKEPIQPSAIRELMIARAREFLREPAAVFWAYGFPLLMILALGIAFRSQSDEVISVDIVAGANAAMIEDALRNSSRFNVAIHDEDEAFQRVRVGRTDLVISRPDEGSALTYRYDPSKPGSALAKRYVDDVLQRDAGRVDPLETESEEITAPGGRYIDFLTPGLLGMGLMGGGLWGVGFAVVDLRLRKLLKRFVATPMKRSDFLLSLVLSRLLFTIPEALVILIFAQLVFGVVNFGGNLPLLALLFLGAIQFSGLGLLIACRASKLETVSGLMNLVMIPMWIGSGIFFSIERFPDMIRSVLGILPLTPLNDAMRGVMLEGKPLWAFGPEIGIMLVWSILSFFFALRFFKWK